MRLKMSFPFRMSFYPLNRQLGVEVDLKYQVIIDREIYREMNLQNKTMWMLSL